MKLANVQKNRQMTSLGSVCAMCSTTTIIILSDLDIIIGIRIGDNS